MSTKTNNLLLTVVLIGTFHLTTNAQNSASPVVLTTQQEVNKTLSTPSEKSAAVAIELPEKLLRNFTRNFPSADNVKWTSTPETFLANFVSDEKTFTTTFNKKGQFVHALIYGKEKDLPELIQRQLKKDFGAFIVFKVIEIKTPETNDYRVILQNANQYIELNMSGQGKVQEMKKYARADG